MAATTLDYRDPDEGGATVSDRLAGLTKLADAAVVTSLLANLSDDLHSLFDPVSESALPIYFGPLLGRLYLKDL